MYKMPFGFDKQNERNYDMSEKEIMSMHDADFLVIREALHFIKFKF